MNNKQPLKVSHFETKSRSQVLSFDPILSTKHLKLKGIKFDYYQHGTYETPIHSTKHHVVCLLLDRIKPERRIDNVYQRENVNFGSLFAVPANAEHWSAWTQPGRFAVFSIKPETLAEIAPESINLDLIELIPTFAQPEPDPLVASISMAIKQQLEVDPDGCSFYIEHLMNALSAHLVQNYCNNKPLFKEYKGGLAPYKLKQVINYINDNLDRRIGLEDLANLLDLSTYYLCREFRNSVGVSPYRYILERRIEKAKELIKNTKLSLADVAYESGFSSQSQMTQHFRKLVGVTPKVYRDKL